ncbi:MAG: hypothetical protein KBT88_10745 [Gammaproteobacteria bacterium]|nr:hypothetical protein [Gammaproteobacteria bacterium]MBQ0840253.1 hypothetical protein [Gammaproteobacteria bacterium]
MSVYQRLFNQHLSSAQEILAELAREGLRPSLKRALEHSALHLLKSAYLCHLRAIADSYGCADAAEMTDIDALLSALTAIDKPAPEAAEIAVLLKEGWLGSFLNAQQQLCLPASLRGVAPPPPAVSQSAIALRDDRDEPAPDADKLYSWLLVLEELVQRQGEMMQEY